MEVTTLLFLVHQENLAGRTNLSNYLLVTKDSDTLPRHCCCYIFCIFDASGEERRQQRRCEERCGRWTWTDTRSSGGVHGRWG